MRYAIMHLVWFIYEWTHEMHFKSYQILKNVFSLYQISDAQECVEYIYFFVLQDERLKRLS